MHIKEKNRKTLEKNKKQIRPIKYHAHSPESLTHENINKKSIRVRKDQESYYETLEGKFNSILEFYATQKSKSWETIKKLLNLLKEVQICTNLKEFDLDLVEEAMELDIIIMDTIFAISQWEKDSKRHLNTAFI